MSWHINFRQYINPSPLSIAARYLKIKILKTYREGNKYYWKKTKRQNHYLTISMASAIVYLSETE